MRWAPTRHADRRPPRTHLLASAVQTHGGNGMTESIVDLKLYERSVEASAQVVKTADETLGTLLDIRA